VTNQKGNGATEKQSSKMDAPDGLDLNPQPKKAVRISKRAGLAILVVVVGILLAYAYGGYRRTLKAEAAARDAGIPRNVGPATQAGSEFVNSIPVGSAAPLRKNLAELQPPGALTNQSAASPCGSNPQTGQPYRFNPQTGQPCDGLPQERLVVRRAPVLPPPPPPPTPTLIAHEATAEERRLAAVYARDLEARMAPTGIRASSGSFPSASGRSGADDFTPVSLVSQPANGHSNAAAASGLNHPGTETQNEYEAQNMQSRKESFMKPNRSDQVGDYLNAARNAPLSRFEIKAGWEIPAVLEQSLNSDLPGELKALVTANVYDTATGLYLLIPQGSRLVGKYDSRVSYGQDGVQVAWSRVIFPDASSIDLNGMIGLDANGNAGLRDKVDQHYERIIGFAALTSLFTAAFEISQRRNQSVLTYPSPGVTASGAVGQELSQTGSQITRKNLNVQPTIKVPVGYKFTVRVNRDILFEAPYEPMQADTLPPLGEKTSGPKSDWGHRK
jgi:type IV secretory pathway VirB10-like protein